MKQFIGKKWTLEVKTLSNGKVAGYVTDAISASTKAINDPSYPSSDIKVPKTVIEKLRRLMRTNGWVEDIYALLKPEYLRELAAKGNGRRLPKEYENTSLARLYFPGDINHEMYVEHYNDQTAAYRLWLTLPKHIRSGFRGRGDDKPVYHHDLVVGG